MFPIAEIPENVVIYDREVITSGGRRLGICNDGQNFLVINTSSITSRTWCKFSSLIWRNMHLPLIEPDMKPTSSPANGTRVEERRVVFKV